MFSEIPRSLLLLLLKLSALSSEVFAACAVRMAGHAQKQIACAYQDVLDQLSNKGPWFSVITWLLDCESAAKSWEDGGN